MVISGSIEVERFMEVYNRQRRALEWIALREYWRADEQDKERVLALYGPVLAEALRKRREANQWIKRWRRELVRRGVRARRARLLEMIEEDELV